ncbi:MAG: MATE family efflux transporter, partial [Bacilli bacterium]|nr:MATE family efflux transporter [Bacilli bacterium]
LAVFRAGGKTKFVMILDCVVMWLVGIPIAILGYHVFNIDNIALLYLLMQLEAVVRISVGLHQYFKYDWLNNIIRKSVR